MTELEALHARDLIARNRIAELERQLRATEQQLRELLERLTLTQQEESVLNGRPDGCIFVGDVRPIVRRVFGKGAHAA